MLTLKHGRVYYMHNTNVKHKKMFQMFTVYYRILFYKHD